MKVYGCKNCGLVLTSDRTPSSSGCPDKLHGSYHNWYEAGDCGNKTFYCKHCGATVSCDRNPSGNGCSSGTSQYHSWTETGIGHNNNRSATIVGINTGIKKELNRTETSDNKEKPTTELKDTLIGKGANLAGKEILNWNEKRKEQNKLKKLQNEADKKAFEEELEREEEEERNAYSKGLEDLKTDLGSDIQMVTNNINSNVIKLNSYRAVSINCVADTDKDWLKIDANRQLIKDLEIITESLININEKQN